MLPLRYAIQQLLTLLFARQPGSIIAAAASLLLRQSRCCCCRCRYMAAMVTPPLSGSVTLFMFTP